MTKLVTDLLAVADAYLATGALGEGTLGMYVFRDARALHRLREGGDIRSRTYERAIDWFHYHWPAGAVWPAGVPRPSSPATPGGASPTASAAAPSAVEAFSAGG